MLSSLHRVVPLVTLTIIFAACRGGGASNITQRPSQAASGTPISSPAAQTPGTTATETVDVNGVSRSAMVYVPAGRRANQPTPAIIVLHAAGSSGARVASQSQMSAEADRLSFIAVYPEGTENSALGGTNWNDGRPIWGTNQPPDDEGFMGKLLDLLRAKYTADPNRISVVGMSNGVFMAARLACELSDRVAAIAVIADPRDDSACALQRPLSVLVVHGTADQNEPYAGGPDIRGIPVPADVDVVAFWRTHDGCASTPVTSQVTPTVELQAYTSCKQGTEVRFYTVRDGGHVWPNASGPSKFAASPAIAEFLLAHPLSR